MRKLVIDLCSGRGGLSRAFLEAGDWTIITVDNEPKFKPTICADVRALSVGDICKALEVESLRPTFEKVVMVMSPPCQRFSLAAQGFPKKGIGEAMEIVGACLEMVAQIQPDYWLLENPKGRLRWFMPGKPSVSLNLKSLGYKTAKPTDLWGNIPFALIRDSPRHNKGLRFDLDVPRQGSRRAEMPLGLSKAVLGAVGG